MSPLDTSRLRYEVVRIARANLGYGDRGDNTGPFVQAIGGTQGQDWCAVFAGYCYRRAYEELGLRIPDWLYQSVGYKLFGPVKGAKALTKALGRAGTIFKPTDARVPLPGDLVCWSRTAIPGDWRGHVGIVTSEFRYIAGNEGRKGSVREGFIKADKLWRFASIQP